ncbi:hypothetical protein DFQ00_10565 [Paenibacillus barcinonensis]|uniref:Uncharacterized protein n=1 Tax=Paenibacillus barcinonensis TaxID=198119 RepID=A0A2V4WDL2_PAEBA|nr:hypothetical protein DFQ00_10565 [Paenibacillus barcinonensis]
MEGSLPQAGSRFHKLRQLRKLRKVIDIEKSV